MIICRKPLVLGIDVAAMAAVGALLAAIGAWILLPLQRDLGALPALREKASVVHRQHAELAALNAAGAQSLDVREQALRAQVEQPLADIATLLARVSELCAQSGVTLLQVRPLASVPADGHRVWELQVRATGPFPGFHELLYRVEQLSPYVEVGNLLVAGSSDPGSRLCELVCTIRVNYLSTEPGA